MNQAMERLATGLRINLEGYCRYLWESQVCYQWGQSNSIVTVDGGFDGENHSERANEALTTNHSSLENIVDIVTEVLDVSIGDIFETYSVHQDSWEDDDEFWHSVKLDSLLALNFC